MNPLLSLLLKDRRQNQKTAHFVTWLRCSILLYASYCHGFVFPYQRPRDGVGPQVELVWQSFPNRLQSSFTTAATFMVIDESSSGENAGVQKSNKVTNPSYLLEAFGRLKDQASMYAKQLDLKTPEAALYALMMAMRQSSVNKDVPLFGLSGSPFLLQCEAIGQAYGGESTDWPGYFTMDHLQAAVEEDFLDAARGSTDNRKGWQITDVSVPRGESFQAARMTFEDVQNALQKGTLILNAAGAHIPRLAGLTLACCDATSLPCALNLYVTNPQMRTSAPPHTDQQDVLVIQTSGRKHWKIFNVPDPALKPHADVFKRGKGEDSLPLYSFDAESLLLETTLSPGDVLFIPAGFPHTTSTVHSEIDVIDKDVSVHLTIGIDHHIWDLDYVSARRLALRKAGVQDKFASHQLINRLSDPSLRACLLAELPLGFLEDDAMVHQVVDTLKAIATRLGDNVDAISTWEETIARLRQQGTELLAIHRDMYLAALDEGRLREAEAAMTAHLGKRDPWTPDRLQRLSVFRVKRYYDQISSTKETLREWSVQNFGDSTFMASDDDSFPNWAFELPVKVGDSVEANLGGAWFAASVTRASGGTYDVAFFDGDRETDLPREAIKLTSKPAISLQATELKRLEKHQGK